MYTSYNIQNQSPNMMWHNTTVQMGIEKALVNMKPIMPNLNICSVEECCMCLSEGIGYELGCSHKKCSRCLLDHIYVNTQGKLNGRVPCYRCRIPFTAEVFFNKGNSFEESQAITEVLKKIEVAAVQSEVVIEKVKPEEAKFQLRVCFMCHTTENLIKLECDDVICKQDLIKESLRQTNNTLLDSIRCILCGKSIKNDFIENAFGDLAEIARIQNEAIIKAMAELIVVDQDVPKIKCETCNGEFIKEDTVTLDCNHSFCKQCPESHFINIIQSNKISEQDTGCLICQIGQFIPDIVRECLLAEDFEKYTKMIAG